MHPPPLPMAAPPLDALSKESPPLPPPSHSWANGQPPDGMFAPPPSRPFWTPNPTNGADESQKPPPLGTPIESNSVVASLRRSGVQTKLILAVAIAVVALAMAVAFSLRHPH
jgi:hypothetical protein